jgi:DNA (cytosine-5)-methyltransferase 1
VIVRKTDTFLSKELAVVGKTGGAYYNERDPFAAQWLRNLIAAGHIAPGDVDDRSITEVKPHELRGYRQCHFFAGIGIWSHALRRAGWSDDVAVWTGSCPCQPFSAAGFRNGFDDERHLWPVWFGLIAECLPASILGEQVAGALDWLDLVSTDLEGAGYAVGAADLCAAGFSGNHARQRLYWMAHADGRQSRHSGALQSSRQHREQPQGDVDQQGAVMVEGNDGWSRPLQPGVFPVADAHPGRLELVRAYGNALDDETATAFCIAAREAA